MVMALFFTVILLSISEIFLLRVVNENKMVIKEREIQKTFYADQAVSQLAINQLNTFINTDLMDTIRNADPNSIVSYTSGRVNAGDGIGWLIYAVRNNNNPMLTQNGDQAEYS